MRIWRKDRHDLGGHVQAMGWGQRYHEIQRIERRRRSRTYQRHGFRWSFRPLTCR